MAETQAETRQELQARESGEEAAEDEVCPLDDFEKPIRRQRSLPANFRLGCRRQAQQPEGRRDVERARPQCSVLDQTKDDVIGQSSFLALYILYSVKL